jgi:Protein of unknown function (DUF3750)
MNVQRRSDGLILYSLTRNIVDTYTSPYLDCFMKTLVKWLARVSAVILILLAGPITTLMAGKSNTDWWNASREPAGTAPDPSAHPAAIVQVYAARAFSWRGAFGVHTWISAKKTNELEYTVYEVIGWRVRSGLPAVVIHQEAPDRYWFGNKPKIIAELRGDSVDDVIDRIDTAARAYPYRNTYTVWPGPNSNTFIAWLGRAAPELKLDLPPTAIGKDWLDAREGHIVAPTPSGTGYQFSLFGLVGVLAGVEEGFEVNLIGLTVGVDPLDLAIKLPGIGRLGGSNGTEPKPSDTATAQQRP